ncbi:MAG: type II toxin-antitoxin system PemK/MazF family toxin [Gemmataceae bacterium]|nr:type II toxin-antitoxin system PemK/MazF family toxin [Gemmataceae bacterium]
MSFLRGDVVLFEHDFSDGSGSKVRPCVIVQNGTRNTHLEGTIVTTINSNVHHASDPTQVFIDIATNDRQATGRRKNSVIKAGKLWTIRQAKILEKIGILPASLQQKLDESLKIALELP